MYYPFPALQKSSRIWIYQANRQFSAVETRKIEENTLKFCEQWAAHGQGLKSAFQVLHNRFLVLAVDEGQAEASGCSIDSSVNFIQELGKMLNIDFFNRTKIAFILNNEVFVESLNALKTKIGSGDITSATPTFNNNVQSIEEFEDQWVIPAKNSWIKRYF